MTVCELPILTEERLRAIGACERMTPYFDHPDCPQGPIRLDTALQMVQERLDDPRLLPEGFRPGAEAREFIAGSMRWLVARLLRDGPPLYVYDLTRLHFPKLGIVAERGFGGTVLATARTLTLLYDSGDQGAGRIDIYPGAHVQLHGHLSVICRLFGEPDGELSSVAIVHPKAVVYFDDPKSAENIMTHNARTWRLGDQDRRHEGPY